MKIKLPSLQATPAQQEPVHSELRRKSGMYLPKQLRLRQPLHPESGFRNDQEPVLRALHPILLGTYFFSLSLNITPLPHLPEPHVCRCEEALILYQYKNESSWALFDDDFQIPEFLSLVLSKRWEQENDIL